MSHASTSSPEHQTNHSHFDHIEQEFMEQNMNSNLYFMKGNFSRLLTQQEQIQMGDIFINSKKDRSIFVYNSCQTKRIYQNFRSKLPWIKPYYAVKTNSCKQILQDLIGLGSNFDCASKSEIKRVLHMGVNPDQIAYSNPIKDQQDLKWAYEEHVNLTTADSIDQLYKIKKYAPNMKVLWRIAIKDNADLVKTHFSEKFGDDFQNQEQIHSRMKEISQIGIKLTGIHFHCGSKKMGTSSFGTAIKLARKCIEIGRLYGHEMSVLDIGGGFGSQTLSENIINDLKPTENDPLNYKVIAEPGRHFSSNCFYILVKVIGRKIKHNVTCYHLNDSIYHSMNNLLTDGISFDNQQNQFYSKMDLKTHSIQKILQFQKSNLFGMTCDGMDILAKNIQTPVGLRCGDWICISGMGAYTLSLKSNFNGMQSTTQIKVWNPEDWNREKMEVGAGENV